MKCRTNLLPPRDHRKNIAEKIIQTFKNHFVGVMCGTDPKFPMQLWWRILRQVEHQLNMIRKSRVAPNVSAFTHLYGQHNYDENFSTPLGTAVKMYVMPEKQRGFDSHTKSGFYLGTSWGYYCCHKVWIPQTKSVRISQAVFFKHKYLNQPSITNSDAILRT